MHVPTYDQGRCSKCKGRVIAAETPRVSKGEKVIVLLAPEEDKIGDRPRDQYLLDVANGKYVAGKPTTLRQRELLIAAGKTFHLPHACPSRR